MKNYTDIEQSKKLEEILPIESADMCYIAHSELINIHEPFYKKMDKEDIPCWSLSALLIVLPTFTIDSSDDHYFRIYCQQKFSEWYDNPIDACYEMICRLKENNLL